MNRLALAFVLCAPAFAFAQTPPARQVAAPASDILNGLVRLPDPASTPSTSSAAILPLQFERTKAGGWAAELDFPVERDGTLALALVSPAAASWKLLAATQGTRLRPIDELFAVQRSIAIAGDSMPGWLVDRRELSKVVAGTLRLRVEAGALAEGWLLASSASDLRAEAFVTTQRLVAGSPIAVAGRALGRELKSVSRATVVFETDSEARELAMHDDGLHDDGAAGDGWFGAFVPEDLLGYVRARVEVLGTTHMGTEFLRCALVVFPVLEPTVFLDGTATAALRGEGELEIAIQATPLRAPGRLHVSAEVWGRDAEGQPTAVCWLSKMLEPVASAGAWELPMTMDLDWLAAAGAGTPLELRAVRVQDPDTDVVHDFAERMALARSPAFAASAPGSKPITAKMLTGSLSSTLGASPPPPQNFTNNRALMLVHGYCSSGSIWPAADFTQPKLEFLDPSANRTHDQFAQLIAQRAVSMNINSFGVVAHSQGGPAALHLLTYYTSGLDLSFGGRRIQSVASPYLGTPLASLGAFACGVNNDMTPSGAATWLAGIPSWARAEVFTWTTANSAAACNAITNLFLTDPEDGTVEKFRSELPGGNNMGHVVGWCHTTGMSNPASYTDHARNLSMDAAAAR